MDDRSWVTTPMTGPALERANALLATEGVEVEAVVPGGARRYIGGVDVETATVSAVAVVDIDGAGRAWLRAVAGDGRRLGGLADTLRAAGARSLLAGSPFVLDGVDVGDWRHVDADRPLWSLAL